MSVELAKALECIGCGKLYPISPINYSDCCVVPVKPFYRPEARGDGLRQLVESSAPNIFRWLQILPSSEAPRAESGFYKVGTNQLIRAYRLAEALGFDPENFYVLADEGPLSGTFKDRGVSIVSQSLMDFNKNGSGYRVLAGTSTGNLSSAIAAAAKEMGFKSVIIVSDDVEEALIQKTLGLGAYVIRIKGTYEVANSIANRVSDNEKLSGIAWINLTLRPIYGEGSKTIGPEIARQLGWKAPDNVVHPIAAGLSFSRIYTGLVEAEKLDLIEKLNTRMYGAQTEACNTIVPSGNPDNPFKIVPIRNPQKSVAGTLNVGNPSNGYDVLEALKASKGSVVALSEEEIEEGMYLVGSHTDFTTGPVGGTVIAAAKRLRNGGIVKPKETTVLVLTDGSTGKAKIKPAPKKGTLIDLNARDQDVICTLEQILA